MSNSDSDTESNHSLTYELIESLELVEGIEMISEIVELDDSIEMSSYQITDPIFSDYTLEGYTDIFTNLESDTDEVTNELNNLKNQMNDALSDVVVFESNLNHNTQSNLLHPPIAIHNHPPITIHDHSLMTDSYADHLAGLINELPIPRNGHRYKYLEVQEIIDEHPEYEEAFDYLADHCLDLFDVWSEDEENEDINSEDIDSSHKFSDDYSSDPNLISI
jgi:hypothetical protein